MSARVWVGSRDKSLLVCWIDPNPVLEWCYIRWASCYGQGKDYWCDMYWAHEPIDHKRNQFLIKGLKNDCPYVVQVKLGPAKKEEFYEVLCRPSVSLPGYFLKAEPAVRYKDGIRDK